MDRIIKLVEHFRRFPGIGPKQAERFVYFLLRQPATLLNEFSVLIRQLQRNIKTCRSCFRFFQKEAGASVLCSICRDATRDVSTLLIVAHDVDLGTIEKSGTYRGCYFVLGATFPVLVQKAETSPQLKALSEVVRKRAAEGLKEIILAFSFNPDGEYTAQVVGEVLSPIAREFGIKISTLGRGLSTGTEIEYSDLETIRYALKNRSHQ